MESVTLLNVRIDNLTQKELLHQLNKGVLVTPNIDDIMKHQKDQEFHNFASQAEFSICDSRVVQLMSKIAGKPLKEAIPGSSFFPAYCDYHAKDENVKIFLLGAKEGVAERAAHIINNRIGREIIVGTYSPPFGFEKDEKECENIVRLISSSSANVVLVGLGNPKQTKWIYNYKSQLQSIDVFMALGATIDFEAGNVKRAPRIFQKLALEWLYRFLMEPKRLFKRYFVDDMQFFYYFGRQLLGIYHDPFLSK
jgi:exopolysaccharide biosynthesis WecB/TagA/CpsF family protein